MNAKIIVITIAFLAQGLFANPDDQVKAKDFTLRDVNGRNYTLSKNLGQGPIIINFWATWCLPCYGEMNELKRLFNTYSSSNLQILSISVDDAKTISKVKMTVRSKKYPFTVLLDSNQGVYKTYHLTGIPQIFLIDKNGTIVYNHKGYKKGDEKKLEEKLQTVIKSE